MSIKRLFDYANYKMIIIMNLTVFFTIFSLTIYSTDCLPLLRIKRAFSYIANETACTVDHIVYRNGDPIPTDDPCETCRCRPPGFACVLRECEIKTGCRAIRRIGECCPLYQCGCEHNGRYYRDGERIPNAESPCYSCYCQGSSITCSLADCKFRFDCEPEYAAGECCPRYDHCPPAEDNFVTVKSTEIPRLTTIFARNHSSTTTMTFASDDEPTTKPSTVVVDAIRNNNDDDDADDAVSKSEKTKNASTEAMMVINAEKNEKVSVSTNFKNPTNVTVTSHTLTSSISSSSSSSSSDSNNADKGNRPITSVTTTSLIDQRPASSLPTVPPIEAYFTEAPEESSSTSTDSSIIIIAASSFLNETTTAAAATASTTTTTTTTTTAKISSDIDDLLTTTTTEKWPLVAPADSQSIADVTVTTTTKPPVDNRIAGANSVALEATTEIAFDVSEEKKSTLTISNSDSIYVDRVNETTNPLLQNNKTENLPTTSESVIVLIDTTTVLPKTAIDDSATGVSLPDEAERIETTTIATNIINSQQDENISINTTAETTTATSTDRESSMIIDIDTIATGTKQMSNDHVADSHENTTQADDDKETETTTLAAVDSEDIRQPIFEEKVTKNESSFTTVTIGIATKRRDDASLIGTKVDGLETTTLDTIIITASQTNSSKEPLPSAQVNESVGDETMTTTERSQTTESTVNEITTLIANDANMKTTTNITNLSQPEENDKNVGHNLVTHSVTTSSPKQNIETVTDIPRIDTITTTASNDIGSSTHTEISVESSTHISIGELDSILHDFVIT